MLERPIFKPHLRVKHLPGEGVLLLGNDSQTCLRGRLYETIVPRLDGRTVDELCGELQDRVTPAEVYYTLAQIESTGHLVEANSQLCLSEAAFWSLLGVPASETEKRLKGASLHLQTFGAIDRNDALQFLSPSHFRFEETGKTALAATDNYLHPDLKAFNQKALESGRPWLLFRPFGQQIWLGPLFVPGKTGCWECMSVRMRANDPVLAFFEKRNQEALPSAAPAHTPATLQLAWGLVNNALNLWQVREELPQLEGKIQVHDAVSGTVEKHQLIRQPACPACALPIEIPKSIDPIVIKSSKKIFTRDGGHRALNPQDTLNRYGHHVSSLVGAVPELKASALCDGEVLHVYSSGYNIGRPAETLSQLKGSLRGNTAGKGATELQAKASALGEGLERHSGRFQGNEPRRLCRIDDLGSDAIHPNDYLLFSEKQFQAREEWNARVSPFNRVTQPFDPKEIMEWSPLWSLTHQKIKWLPTSFCYYRYPQKTAFAFACSNGNAAGNTREEAILQGFLEVIERDSVAVWWYNRLPRPRVNLESFKEPYLFDLQEFFHKKGREYWVLDVTADLGIPVFACISRRIDSPDEQILLGFGAHLDARIALLRAVTETAQMLDHLSAFCPNTNGKSDPDTFRWLSGATVDNQPYLRPMEGVVRHRNDFKPNLTDDLRDDILFCRGLVESKGMEVLVLDQTRPEIGLPVVKVVVPGMRHFWARWAKGRLYDVPVQLGWLKEPTSEENLNPMLMFL